MAGTALELDQAAVAVLAIVIGILLAALLAINYPALDIQTAVFIILMLRPQDREVLLPILDFSRNAVTS